LPHPTLRRSSIGNSATSLENEFDIRFDNGVDEKLYHDWDPSSGIAQDESRRIELETIVGEDDPFIEDRKLRRETCRPIAIALVLWTPSISPAKNSTNHSLVRHHAIPNSRP